MVKKSTFMQKELDELRSAIQERREEKLHTNSPEAYGYHVNPKTGKLISSQPRRRVVKTIRLKKSKSLNNPIPLGKE
tara:strand:+ start:351 stop:581 length:231 start_codon:yes stop_codon:yes gene_type:complete